MSYHISHIARIIHGEGVIAIDTFIEHLLLDSRKIYSPASSLFFAIRGPRRDGHQFIPELYKKGIRNFVVAEQVTTGDFPEANFLMVADTLVALQELAAHHRNQFDIPVIGITGSNGKTVVKEWLYQLLQEDYTIVRSPKSYNSQIGVPLSVWGMNEKNNLALFEAGISEFGEMLRLEKIIRPTWGVLTNIGEAHSEGFNDAAHKFREKMVLFRNAKKLIGRAIDFEERGDVIDMLNEELEVLTWGSEASCDFAIERGETIDQHSPITIIRKEQKCKIRIPFTDEASVENAVTCTCVLLELGIDPVIIAERISKLHSVNMRLELKKGINHCSIINDSYSADLSSLEIALNFLDQQGAGGKKTVILSDFLQSAISDDMLYSQVLENLLKHRVSRLVGIGEKISASFYQLQVNEAAGLTVDLYPSTEDFIHHFRSSVTGVITISFSR